MRTKFNPMVDLNIKNIEKYINWKDLIRNEKLDESLIEYYIDMFRLDDIIMYQKVSQDFLENNIVRIKKLRLWKDVCCYQKLTENFMETNQDELEWNCISQYQKLSEEFIIRFYNRINWFWATLFQDLSIDIFERQYIEINYKEKFYIIEIFYVENTFYYSIKQTTQNSLDLKKISEI